MPTHREIYAGHASEYERLVAREDYEGNILRAVRGILPLKGVEAIDLGAGTGRLACLLAPHVKSVAAFDISAHMLQRARRQMETVENGDILVAAAEHRRLPLRSGSVDLLVSGWSVSYVAVWDPERWRQNLDDWLGEAERVLRQDGWIVLFESLGTGNDTPTRLPHLESFYDWLSESGFGFDWIRTDYRFESVDIADELVGFFFGDEIRKRVKRTPPVTLAECTGVWSRLTQGQQSR
jgi:ubiquinone/menaquinone biosynthesis C-methylase UbiE